MGGGVLDSLIAQTQLHGSKEAAKVIRSAESTTYLQCISGISEQKHEQSRVSIWNMSIGVSSKHLAPRSQWKQDV